MKIESMYEKVEKIIENFDFEEVVRVMGQLQWKWAMDEGLRYPTIAEMKNVVKHMIIQAVENYSGEDGFYTVSSGGFCVRVIGDPNGDLPTIILSFELVTDMGDDE